MTRFVSECCDGERCWCGAPAEHKVHEAVFSDDPRHQNLHLPESIRPMVSGFAGHELTAYICHEHFRQIMGPAAGD